MCQQRRVSCGWCATSFLPAAGENVLAMKTEAPPTSLPCEECEPGRLRSGGGGPFAEEPPSSRPREADARCSQGGGPPAAAAVSSSSSCSPDRDAGATAGLAASLASLREEITSLDATSVSAPLLDRSRSRPLQMELSFYNDDGNYQRVLVEKGLRAVDLCQLLAMKNRGAKDPNWTLIEVNNDAGIERIVEDHEEVLPVYLLNRTAVKFLFKKEFRKFEFFHSPLQFFPPELCEIKGTTDATADTFALARNFALQNSLTKLGEPPPISGQLWYREPNKQVWSKMQFTLSDRILLMHAKNNSKKPLGFVQYAAMETYNVYSIFRSDFRTPTDFGICLMPAENAEDGMPKFLFCDTEKIKSSWVAALRMARYGVQLRDNYLQSRQRLQESFSPSLPDYFNPHKDSHEIQKSRVAMDFTGPSGRIVEDPREALAIAVAEGHSWRKRRGLNSLLGGSRKSPSLDLHSVQPWFHNGLTREAAEQLLRKHGTVDGVFLVRNSHSRKGSFVLSFIYDGRIYHSQISVITDRLKGVNCFTLDKGDTKFFDLIQLIDFYQLNRGCLPVRLTYYLVVSATKCALQTDSLYASSC